MIRVLVVDDHPIVLAGLSALIQSDTGLELIATARTAAEALAVLTEPDIALLDLHLPDGDGISLGATLKQRWPRLRVVVFTMHADQSVVRSLGTGLDGYLLKDSDPEDVLAAIHSAARGTLVLGRGTQAAVERGDLAPHRAAQAAGRHLAGVHRRARTGEPVVSGSTGKPGPWWRGRTDAHSPGSTTRSPTPIEMGGRAPSRPGPPPSRRVVPWPHR